MINLQKEISFRIQHQSFSDSFRESSLNQHLCNNKANLLTRLEPCCHKILGTRPRMTGDRDANSFGRSMIEMLGVLAIIAVLSVGGITGYSKAMKMWRSNVQRNLLSELISDRIRF